MIHDLMGSGTMWGMGLLGILSLAVLVLIVVALVKYIIRF